MTRALWPNRQPTEGDLTLSETMFAWQDTSLSARERAERLVDAMTLEQKIAQLHGAMETIDIYAITREAAESGADLDQLPRRSGLSGM